MPPFFRQLLILVLLAIGITGVWADPDYIEDVNEEWLVDDDWSGDGSGTAWENSGTVHIDLWYSGSVSTPTPYLQKQGGASGGDGHTVAIHIENPPEEINWVMHVEGEGWSLVEWTGSTGAGSYSAHAGISFTARLIYDPGTQTEVRDSRGYGAPVFILNDDTYLTDDLTFSEDFDSQSDGIYNASSVEVDFRAHAYVSLTTTRADGTLTGAAATADGDGTFDGHLLAWDTSGETDALLGATLLADDE